MNVQSKYVRYREEVMETKNVEEKKGEEKPLPPKEVTPSPAPTPLPSKPPLAEVERPKAITQLPLPGGGVRNLDYKGPLSPRELDQVEKLYPVYKQAEKESQVNWKVLAGIHYRESSLGLNSKAKGNEFQFDGVLKNRASGDLLHDMIQAGKTLQEKAMNGLYSSKAKKFLVPPTEALKSHQTDGHNVRVAAFLYNGPVYRTKAAAGAAPYDRSPYVLNRLDQNHWDMDLYLGNKSNPRWGTDRRLGVIPFVLELGKAFFD